MYCFKAHRISKVQSRFYETTNEACTGSNYEDTVNKTRSYFSEGNRVSFRKDIQSEKDWRFVHEKSQGVGDLR